MEDILQLEKCLLMSFHRTEFDGEDDQFDFIKEIREGHYLNILQSSSCANIYTHVFKSSSEDEPLEDIFLRGALQYLDECGNDANKALYLLSVGVAALNAWQQENWTGPSLFINEDTEPISWLKNLYQNDVYLKSTNALERPLVGDVTVVTKHPSLLLLACSILRACSGCSTLKSGGWWWLRALFAHQQLLGDTCLSLYENMKPLLEAGPPVDVISVDSSAFVLLNLEIARIYLWYGHINKVKTYMTLAQESSGVKLELVGALGKRTRFQIRDLPQLALKVEVEQDEQGEQNLGEMLPKDVHLNDEIRLEKINFTDGEIQAALLTPEQQAVVLGTFVLTQKSQPHDELANEELMPYLQCVLAGPQWWSLQTSALFHRSKLEGRERRTIERAMMQMQELETAADRPKPCPRERLHGLYCSYLPSRMTIQTELAHLLISLGCVQSALDIYLQLHEWELAVNCYTLLQLRHKAAELLRRELALKESVPLLCLLGDATDETEHYARAWELSGERSARAQRHWGLYHFKRKEYKESISHLKKSLECNSLQIELWIRLGYAALECEDWELSASAYRRYCDLNPDNLEAWNNLAKAYVKMGQKARAWRALQEALKSDFENWKLWDNVMAVSTDCGAFEEVLRAYHRLLDLRDGRHVDLPVLEVLVQAITQNLPDNSGEGTSRLRQQALALFGRITSKVCGDPSVWQLYAELNSGIPDQTQQTLERTTQYLQRAHRYATQANNWTREEKPCREVLRLCIKLADANMKCANSCEQAEQSKRVLYSARLSLKGVISRVQQQHELALLVVDELDKLQQKLTQIDEIISSQQV